MAKDTKKQTPPAAFDLAAHIDRSEKVATVEYIDGFKLKIRYLGKATLQSIARSCMVWKFDPKSKVRNQELDNKAFAAAFAKQAIAGWEGATPDRLSNIVPMKIDDLSEEDRNKEIPYSEAHMKLLIEVAMDLDGFIQDAAIDLALFNPNMEAETENSDSSQDGS